MLLYCTGCKARKKNRSMEMTGWMATTKCDLFCKSINHFNGIHAVLAFNSFFGVFFLFIADLFRRSAFSFHNFKSSIDTDYDFGCKLKDSILSTRCVCHFFFSLKKIIKFDRVNYKSFLAFGRVWTWEFFVQTIIQNVSNYKRATKTIERIV